MKETIISKSSIKNIVLVISGSALLAISAQISVPLPFVSITTQSLVLMMLALTMHRNIAMATIILYIVEGMLGLPVFSNFGNGATRLLGSSGGYLIGYIPAMFVMSTLLKKSNNIFTIFASLVLGNAVLYAFGLAQLSFFVPSEKLIAVGLAPFVIGDTLKILAVTSFATTFKK